MQRPQISPLLLALVSGFVPVAYAHVPMPEYAFRNREILAILEAEIGPRQTIKKIEFKGKVAGSTYFELRTTDCDQDARVDVRAATGSPESPVRPLIFSATLSECRPTESESNGDSPSMLPPAHPHSGVAPAPILYSRAQIRTMLESAALRKRITLTDAIKRIERMGSSAGSGANYVVESEHCRVKVRLKSLPITGPVPILRYRAVVGKCF